MSRSSAVSDLIFSPDQVKEISKTHLDKIRGGDLKSGVRTGVPSLDKYLSPLLPGQMAVVLARPSNGKSLWGMHMIREAATSLVADPDSQENKEFGPPIVVSAEMSIEEIAVREISHFVPYNSALLFRGEVEDWDDIYSTVNQIRLESPIYYIGHSGYSKARRPKITMDNIANSIAAIVEETGKPPKMIMVDYAQRIKLDGVARDRRLEISEIVERCKDMAIAMHSPVVLCSQAGRSVEEKSPPVPDMRDAKESGNIEETADVVFSLMRPSRYYKIGEIIPKTDNLVCDENLFYIRILKQRMGAAGQGFWLHFNVAISDVRELEVNRHYLDDPGHVETLRSGDF